MPDTRHHADASDAAAPESGPRSSRRARNAGNARVVSRQNVVVLVLFGVIGIVVPLAIIFVDVDPREGPDVAANTAASVMPGDCVNIRLALLSCDTPHYGEVFFVGPDRANVSDPSVNQASFSGWVIQNCKTAFAAYVGVPLEHTTYVMVASPSARQWTAGDRPFICVAANPDRSLNTSIKDSAK
jgi:hypothetical protein